MPDAIIPSVVRGQKLADGRVARGLTQTALARQIGVSRQFLNQMEAGRVLPNVVIALRLAAVLGTTVEELFGAAAAEAEETISVSPAGQAMAVGTRLRVGRIGQAWIAHPAVTADTLAVGFAAADAVMEEAGQARLLVKPAAAAANLLVAGCDSALALLQPPTPTSDGGRCHWMDCSSGRALDLLAAGRVHVAGIHYSGADGSGNLRELGVRDPGRRWTLIRFTRWEQGWIVGAGKGRRFGGVASLAKGTWKLANRDASAAARRWLDQELGAARIEAGQIPGYANPLPSANAAAHAVASGQADVSVGPQALALAHGLDFVPVEAVDFDLVASAVWWRSEAGRGLQSRVRELSTSGVLANLPGYAVTQSGYERARTAPRRARI